RAPSCRSRLPPWPRAGVGDVPRRASCPLPLRARIGMAVAVIEPRRFRRDQSGGEVALDRRALAPARIAPSAAAGGAEGEPVAWPERDAGRLEKRRGAAVAPRQPRLVARARPAAVQPPGRILGALAVHVGNRLLQRAIGELDAEPAAMLAGAAGIGAQR